MRKDIFFLSVIVSISIKRTILSFVLLNYKNSYDINYLESDFA